MFIQQMSSDIWYENVHVSNYYLLYLILSDWVFPYLTLIKYIFDSEYLLFVQYHKKLTLTQRISLCRNNNIRSRQKLNHPKKQPIVNIRRLNDEQQKMYSNLSIDERDKKSWNRRLSQRIQVEKKKICCGYIFIDPMASLQLINVTFNDVTHANCLRSHWCHLPFCQLFRH